MDIIGPHWLPGHWIQAQKSEILMPIINSGPNGNRDGRVMLFKG